MQEIFVALKASDHADRESREGKCQLFVLQSEYDSVPTKEGHIDRDLYLGDEDHGGGTGSASAKKPHQQIETMRSLAVVSGVVLVWSLKASGVEDVWRRSHRCCGTRPWQTQKVHSLPSKSFGRSQALAQTQAFEAKLSSIEAAHSAEAKRRAGQFHLRANRGQRQ